MRRVYEVVIVDPPAVINDMNLAFLDAPTRSSRSSPTTPRRSTARWWSPTRSAMIGYPPTKVRYLVNRSDSTGGFDPEVLNQALGRVPEHTVCSGGMLVVRTNNEGIPFVIADPTAQISQDLVRTARELIGSPVPARPRPDGGSRGVSDPRPIGVFDSGVGGLTVLREVLRRSPHESTIYLGDNARAPYGVRTDDEVLRFSAQALDVLAAATSRHWSSPATRPPPSRSSSCGPVRPADPGRRPPRCRGRGARHAEPPRRRDRDAGDRALARLLQRDQGREPGRGGLRARDAAFRADGRGGHPVGAGAGGRRRRGAGAPVRRA